MQEGRYWSTCENAQADQVFPLYTCSEVHFHVEALVVRGVKRWSHNTHASPLACSYRFSGGGPIVSLAKFCLTEQNMSEESVTNHLCKQKHYRMTQ